MTIFHNFALRIQSGGAKIVLKPNWNMFNNSAGIYLFKVNNRNTRTRCEICSKLTINTFDK